MHQDTREHLHDGITYRINPVVTNSNLNALFAESWPDHTARDFQQHLRHSLAYVCAYSPKRLVGFVNLAWDGGLHAFLLDTTVAPPLRRRGIGQTLVHMAVDVAKSRGCHWVHVDYETDLEPFYMRCGFILTRAGLRNLSE